MTAGLESGLGVASAQRRTVASRVRRRSTGPTGWFHGWVPDVSSTTATPSGLRLGQARARRWWVSGRRIGSIERAAQFVEDVGFAMLFPSPRLASPSLWEAVAGEDAEPFAAGMGASEQKVWAWKDELPRRGLAWYGSFLANRGTLLSPELLAALYQGEGTADDHESLPLSATAHEVAQALAGEPLTSTMLRGLIGDRARYQRAVAELQRQLLVTTAGVRESRHGWPSALLTLTCHRFAVGGGQDPAQAATRFLDTLLEATPGELARAFGWPVPQARRHLDELVSAGRAVSRSDPARYLTRPGAPA